jgi:hypothetical protein
MAQDSPITFLRSVIYSDSGLHRGYVILRTNDFTCPENRVSTFSFDHEIIFPVIFATVIFGEGFSCATRDEAHTTLDVRPA